MKQPKAEGAPKLDGLGRYQARVIAEAFAEQAGLKELAAGICLMGEHERVVQLPPPIIEHAGKFYRRIDD